MTNQNKNTKKSKYINGPVNAFRMEGQINDAKKVIYLFGDYHLEPSNQTQCDDIMAIEMKDYLLENFLKLGKNNTVDFFLEIPPYYVNEKNHQYRSKYIHSLMFFFKKCFNFDTTKNKVYTSTKLSNVRFHYMDIRNLISFDFKKYFNNINIYDISQLVNYFSNYFYLSNESINLIIEIMNKIHDNYIFIYNSLFKKNNLKKEYNEKMYSREYTFDENTAQNIIKKMYTSHDKSIQTILKNIKKKYIKHKILKILLLTKKITDLLNEYIQFNNNYNDIGKYRIRFIKLKINIYYKLNILSEKLSTLGVILTDMYFIRRFMDKKYIKNSIIYGGLHHTMNYIFILIKYFNFKITHFSYSSMDINEITKIIKNSKNNFDVEELYNLFIPYSDNIYQCSNVTTFPNKFM